MKVFNKRHMLLSAFLLLLTACQPQPAGEEGHDHHGEAATHSEGAAHEEEAGHGEEAMHEEGLVNLTEKQLNAVGIETAQLMPQQLGASIHANGQLEVPPQNEARVSAYLGGNIGKLLVIEGDKVQKGQTLARLVHPDLVNLQQDYQEALSRMDFLKKDQARKKKLFEEGVSSGKEFQQADADYKVLQSRAAALKAKLGMLHLDPEAIAGGKVFGSVPVKTPIGGYVKAVNVVIGQYITPQQELFEIVDNSHIHADLMVYERDMDKVKKGQEIRFTVGNMPDKEYRASIYSVGKVVEENPKAVHIHAEIENGTGDLIPGMYVRGRIITGAAEVLALPEGGIISEGEKSFIFLAEEGKNSREFRMTEVVPGLREGNLVEIKPLSELPDSAWVVTEGAYYLLAEMKKGEAGHSH